MIKGCLFLRRTEEEHISLIDWSTSHKAYLKHRHTHSDAHTSRPAVLLGPDHSTLLSKASFSWLTLRLLQRTMEAQDIWRSPAKEKAKGVGGWRRVAIDNSKISKVTIWKCKKSENLLREEGPGEAMGLNLSQLLDRGTRPVQDSNMWSLYSWTRNSKAVEKS